MQLVELYNPLAPSDPNAGFFGTPIAPIDTGPSILTPLFGDTSTSAWQTPGGQWNYSFIAGTPDTTSGTTGTGTPTDPLTGGISYLGGGGLVPLSPTYAQPGVTQPGTTVPGTTVQGNTVPGYTQQAPVYDMYGNLVPQTGTTAPTGGGAPAPTSDPSTILPFTFDQNGNPIPSTQVPTSGTGGSGAQVPIGGNNLLTQILGGNLPNQSMQFGSSPFPGMTDLLSGQQFDQVHGPNLQMPSGQQSGPLWNITPGGQNPIMGMQPQQGGGQSPGAQALPQQAPPMPNAPPLQLDRRALPGGALAPGRPPMQGGINAEGGIVPGIGAIAAGGADGVTPEDIGSALDSIGRMPAPPVPFPRPRQPGAPQGGNQSAPPPDFLNAGPAHSDWDEDGAAMSNAMREGKRDIQGSPVDQELQKIFSGALSKMNDAEQKEAIANYANALKAIDSAPPSPQLKAAAQRLKEAQKTQADVMQAQRQFSRLSKPTDGLTEMEAAATEDPGLLNKMATVHANMQFIRNDAAVKALGGKALVEKVHRAHDYYLQAFDHQIRQKYEVMQRTGAQLITPEEMQQLQDPEMLNEAAYRYAASATLTPSKNMIGEATPYADEIRSQHRAYKNQYINTLSNRIKHAQENYKQREAAFKEAVTAANKAVDDAQQDYVDAENRQREQRNFDKEIAWKKYEQVQNKEKRQGDDLADRLHAGDLLRKNNHDDEMAAINQERLSMAQERVNQAWERIAQSDRNLGFKQERADMSDYFKALNYEDSHAYKEALTNMLNSPDRSIRNYAAAVRDLSASIAGGNANSPEVQRAKALMSDVQKRLAGAMSQQPTRSASPLYTSPSPKTQEQMAAQAAARDFMLRRLRGRR